MTLAILVVAVNRLTPVAARCDAVDGVGEFDARGRAVGVILRGEVGNWLDLTPGSHDPGSLVHVGLSGREARGN